MTSTCRVLRPTGATVDDPVTHEVVPELAPVDVRGVCKVQSQAAVADRPVVGEAPFLVERVQIHFPVGDPLEDDDIVVLDSCPLDPLLAGKRFRLVQPARGSFKTAQRWEVLLYE